MQSIGAQLDKSLGVAAKRFIVVGKISEGFLSKFQSALTAFTPGDPMDPATPLAPLSTETALITL